MKESTSKVKPLFLTQKNSEAASGEQLKFWKRHYPHLVRRIGSKDVIVSEELEQAVKASGGAVLTIKTEPANQADAAEQVRELLRRAGGR